MSFAGHQSLDTVNCQETKTGCQKPRKKNNLYNQPKGPSRREPEDAITVENGTARGKAWTAQEMGLEQITPKVTISRPNFL